MLDLKDDVPNSPIFNVTELYEYHSELPSSEDIVMLHFTDVASGNED